MTRLFTVGCSFTKYFWPTWADILGRQYTRYHNYAQSGIGNRAILERLNELLTNHAVSKNDTVIVQWSAVHRIDIHKADAEGHWGWIAKGDIFSPTTSEYHSLFKDLWNEYSYTLHTCNYITMAKSLLEKIGCKWYFLSMHDITADIAKYPELRMYLEEIQRIEWLPAMHDWFIEKQFPCKELIHATGKPTNNILVTRLKKKDSHPTPKSHALYLKSFLAEKIDKEIDMDWAIQADEVLFTDIFKYEHMQSVYKDKLEWDSEKMCERGL